MKKAFEVAKWEFLQKVMSKEFIISVVVTPVIFIVFSILPSLLADNDSDSPKAITILDSTGLYEADLRSELEKEKLEDGQPRYVIPKSGVEQKDIQVAKKRLDDSVFHKKVFEGYIYIYEQPDSGLQLEFRSKSMGNFRDLRIIDAKFNSIRRTKMLENKNLEQSLLDSLTKEVDLRSVKITLEGEEKINFETQFFSTFIVIMALFFIIMFTGGSLVRSLVEEKSNRLIEIILSSCRPDDLLMGKVLGLTLLVFAQLTIWAMLAIAFGGPMLASASIFQNLHLVIPYFMLAFLFYVSIFVGLGSIVNTEQEAQQVTTYLTLLIIFPVVILMPIIQNPDQEMVKIFAYIPFTSPLVMIARVNVVQVPFYEHLIAMGILILSIAIVIKVSVKIFRIGILSYGKLPSFKELMNWLRS
ncbi:MAG: ABC transporter permease [Ignavibacteriaceae bacterium]|nr:MAG: ABC transporter permease [Ignavibacteriaceae bacterium]